MVIDTEDRDSDEEYRVMPPLMYPEESDDEEFLSKPPSTETTPDPGPPSKKTTEELTLEPDSDALLEPSAPMREDYMGQLSPKDIVIHQK